MLSIVCALSISLIQGTQPWKIITTKVGATVSVPVDLGKPTTSNIEGESFKPKAWSGCTLKVTKKSFGKEDPEDSAAVKLEDVVYNDLDLSDDRISSVTFGLLQGFPEVDIEGAKKGEVKFRYKVCRTRSQNYLMCLSGKSLPADDVVKQMFDSFKLPKEPPSGNWAKWLPTAGTAQFNLGKVEAWAPTPFKKSDDFPDFGDSDTKGEAHAAEIGYSSYTVAIVNLPAGMEEKLDEEAIDKLIHAECDEDEDGDKSTFGDFKTFSADKLQFRSTTYFNDTLEGRVDVCILAGKLYMVSTVVPRGMLESEAVKHFFSSLKIH